MAHLPRNEYAEQLCELSRIPGAETWTLVGLPPVFDETDTDDDAKPIRVEPETSYGEFVGVLVAALSGEPQRIVLTLGGPTSAP